jgi:hypothetical protein
VDNIPLFFLEPTAFYTINLLEGFEGLFDFL